MRAGVVDGGVNPGEGQGDDHARGAGAPQERPVSGRERTAPADESGAQHEVDEAVGNRHVPAEQRARDRRPDRRVGPGGAVVPGVAGQPPRREVDEVVVAVVGQEERSQQPAAVAVVEVAVKRPLPDREDECGDRHAGAPGHERARRRAGRRGGGHQQGGDRRHQRQHGQRNPPRLQPSSALQGATPAPRPARPRGPRRGRPAPPPRGPALPPPRAGSSRPATSRASGARPR